MMNVKNVKKRADIKKEIHFNILNDIVIFSLQRFDPFLSAKNDEN